MTKKSLGIGATLTLVCVLFAVEAQTQQQDLYSVSEIQSRVDASRVQRFEQTPGLDEPAQPAEQALLDRANDPPGLLQEGQLASIKALAARLSEDRGWLTPSTLAALETQSLRLDELFTGAPQLVTVDGELYRVLVERVGGLWDGFDPAVQPFFVFFNHELYDGLGQERAVAFENGDETVIFDWDFERLPAIGLTLEKLAPEEELPRNPRLQAIDAPIQLGSHRLAVKRNTTNLARQSLGLGGLSRVTAAATSCSPEIAPTSCTSGKPVCGTAGYTPYFVLSKVKIKTDHEGCCFKGNPEIELFPMRLDATSPVGGTTNPTTNLIFSGRTITDVAGRSRYLPDVNSINVWYTANNGLALFPTNSGNEWSGTLVEQDDAEGVLKMKATRVNVTKLYRTVNTIVNDSRQLDFFFLLKAIGQLLDLIGLFNDGDDLYQESIGVANNLFCTNGVGQPFPKVFTMVSAEWEMQGYYACVNPTCVPPPPPPEEPPCGPGTGTICP